jgi:3-methylcrotonyl-CoA carboxylase alpha subunit
MTVAGVPCVPGYHGSNQDPLFLEAEADKMEYPVLIKAVKGGGGKGMRIVRSKSEFQDQLRSAKNEALNSFGNDHMLVEKYITTPRHIEVQVFADKHGNCVALGERDCSIQRRHQKILEESPAPHLPDTVRKDLWGKARAAALAVGYEGAGTVEFIFDNDTGNFYFMEMNTRLQVEHPVTEMVTGQDLVHWQILVAEGAPLPLTQEEIEANIAVRGHAIEARIYAENPDQGFIPDSGRLLHVRLPKESEDVRIDAGFVAGDEVSAHYDPMISKLIVRGANREEALRNLSMALEEYEIAGPITNIEFLKAVCKSADFASGAVETGYIEKHREELFVKEAASDEILAQVALAIFTKRASGSELTSSGLKGSQLGFSAIFQQRQFRFTEMSSSAAPDAANPTHDVQVQQLSSDSFRVRVNGRTFEKVTSQIDGESPQITSFFPHTRLDTRVIQDEDTIIAFQRGQQYRFSTERAKWMEKALGIKDVANSVLAPMPCKILSVEVSEGQTVEKDQPLVVIESMKMETVIRSPHNGTIAKIVHRKGVSLSSIFFSIFLHSSFYTFLSHTRVVGPWVSLRAYPWTSPTRQTHSGSANNLPCRTNARVERRWSNLPATIKTCKLNMLEEDYILYDME